VVHTVRKCGSGTCLPDSIFVLLPLKSVGSMLTMLFWAGLMVEALLISGISGRLGILRHVLPFEPHAGKYICPFRQGLYWAIGLLAVIWTWTFIGASGNVSPINIERAFRQVQSVFLLLTGGLIFYRGLAMGKNAKGMFLGYGVYVAASLTIGNDLAFHTQLLPGGAQSRSPKAVRT